jgi:Tol biopolymer transport system component
MIMRRLPTLLILLTGLSLLLAACAAPAQSTSDGPMPPETQPVEALPTLPVTEPPTAVPTEPPTEVPTDAPTLPVETREPTPSIEVGEMSPLALLVVTKGAGLELATFGFNGDLQPLSTRPFAALSPDGTQIAFVEGDDIWLEPVDQSTAPVNLTNSPEIIDSNIQWWPARPGWLVSLYQPVDDMGYSSFIAMLRMDGTAFVPLEDEARSMSVPALSPDGVTIAYDLYGQPALLNVDSGEKFDPGLNVPEHPVQTMGFPAFSTDGSQVIFKLYDKEGWIGTGLYTLASQSWKLIHEYVINGGTEPWAQAAFSPDGRWLALVNQSDPAVSMGRGPALWVLPLAGGDPVLIGAGSNPMWSPDSTRLVFTQSTAGAFDTSFLQMVLADSWAPVQLPELPGGYYASSWR